MNRRDDGIEFEDNDDKEEPEEKPQSAQETLTGNAVRVLLVKNKAGTIELDVHLQKYCRFKDDVPGEDWMSSVMQRHNPSAKKPSILERSRVVVTSNPFSIYEFYNLAEKELSFLSLEDKPSHVYNSTESAM
ncbi:hypothetical protein AVEN_114737-1 [Araneus ventricosus]|uniref:Uncharacterized protein n=1 Tax=Araneus ventricosus TaxID=182803 RepID=A0A4Y2SQY6_ARAVE|nr:hypothetical protein AVEN_114737-1 [Araneus ventricosus]